MDSLHILSLGCARNDVDSEELAARFSADGFSLVENPEDADVIVANTCGFIEAAKAESIDEILSMAELKNHGKVRKVIAAGCMATRYGQELASSLVEADAVIGFDGYPDIAHTVRQLLAGTPIESHTPTDRRHKGIKSLPLTVTQPEIPVPAWLPTRKRLSDSPMAPLKIASGCDRRCTFCAIPAFRGNLVSRLAEDIVREARWLGEQGVKELFLVSENTTAYGKDLGNPTALEALLSDLSEVEGIEWIRLSYLQPAEVRQSLIEAIASTRKVVPYMDLPFQHASPSVLKRMRRFGDADSFLGLLGDIRSYLPNVGIRTNVIVGFPGETQDDLKILAQFLAEASLDAIGVFPYSNEEGTQAFSLDNHIDGDEILSRAARLTEFADIVTSIRAGERTGERVDVLIESVEDGFEGRSAQQGPEDGHTYVTVRTPNPPDLSPGIIISGVISDTDGVDWHVDV